MLAKAKLEVLTWEKVRNNVKEVNPALAKIIDELSPSDDHFFVKVAYPYGSEILKRAVLMLPDNEGQLIPITDSRTDPKIRAALDYNLNSNPVSLVLKNSFEIFLPLEDRTVPFGLINAGTVFGAWRVLNPEKAEQPAFLWEMTAGARSVFILPKITEMQKHRQLKKSYNLTADVPRSLIAHWEIFRQLANSSPAAQQWDAEILYFSKAWFDHLDDKKWKSFYYYFHDSVWGGSEIWRNQFIWNLVFSMILEKYEARPSAYIMDTVKYLLYMGASAFPGFAPVRNTLAGPFDEIQRIYTEEYELKHYPPIIMQPEIFNMHESKECPVYYSLQFPNAPEFKPSSRVRTSFISDLHEIRSLLIRYEQELLSDKFNLSGTSLSDLFNYTDYDYFHSGVDLHAGMLNSADMPKQDAGLLTTLNGKVYQNFPEACAFVKGCIRLSVKKDT